MKPGFADAASLRPVTLPRGASCSFLPCHVREDAQPRTYSGSIGITKKGKTLASVPGDALRAAVRAALRLKAYGDPQRDFLVASYTYINIDMIKEENGGDAELAPAARGDSLRDHVAHGQTMHWNRGNCNAETLEAIAAMKEAGMRTDVLPGGLSPPHNSPRLSARPGSAVRRDGEWFDRHVGHHNVFIGYGDEPGGQMAGQCGRSSRRTSAKDSSSSSPAETASSTRPATCSTGTTSPRTPPMIPPPASGTRSTMRTSPGTRCNTSGRRTRTTTAARTACCRTSPATARSAITPATDLGPYNDDATTYRPMVFVYGMADGVIDTLQWEGYREGVDDIRYATLLHGLAAKAAAATNLDTVYAGRKAQQWFALFDKDSADLSTARLEMIRMILQLASLPGVR